MSYSTDPDSPKDNAKQNIYLCLVGALALTVLIFAIVGFVFVLIY